MTSSPAFKSARYFVLPNAETIRLVNPDGKAISVTTLKQGDKVLSHIEKAGRHFGMQVKETLIER